MAEYLRCFAEKAKSSWDRREADHPGHPAAQVRAWLEDMAARVTSGDERGCPLANAAVELPEKDHPARRVIEAFKTAQRRQRLDSAVRRRRAGGAGIAGRRTIPAARRRTRDGAALRANDCETSES